MSAHAIRRAALCSLLIAATAALGGGVASGAPAKGVAWDIALVAQPTNLTLTANHFGEPREAYVLVLTNTGGARSEGPTALIMTLPPGVTLEGEVASPGWECQVVAGSSILTCVDHEEVPALGHTAVLTVPVAVAETGVRKAVVRVSGGGAPPALSSFESDVGAEPPPFGLIDFSNFFSDISGGPDTQAGDHPFGLTTTLDLPQFEVKESHDQHGVGSLRAVQLDLPAGVAGNPQAALRCPIVRVATGGCSAGSQVGVFMANYNQGIFEGSGGYPIYNVVPEQGYPAEFGFYAPSLHKVVFVYASVRAVPEYGLHVAIPDIPNIGVTNTVTTFFGDPQTMDGGTNPSIAFFTGPSDCTHGPLVTTIETESWEEPGHWAKSQFTAPPVSNCGSLQFQPAVAVAPNTSSADEPTGYNVDLQVPQSQTAGLEGLATPDLKNATVTLPQGVSISPGAGDGLTGCAAESIDLSSTETGHCPLASQVGTAEAHTPLLADPLHGHVYVALPTCGGGAQAACADTDAASGALFGAYLELEGSGVVIKQHGTISADPSTGRLTASFKNAPQFPFDDLKLTLKDGARAPLANPQTCGEALTTSDMTPWSSPYTPDATPMSAFSVTGCNGPPFAPAFEAGSVNPAAAAYTNFTTTFSRSDRQQNLSAIQVKTPPGLLGMLSHVTLCGDADAATGSCSAASQIGTASASAGAGSHPFWVSGPVYLTGPYNGAPFGLSIPIQAKAGPFNLGTIVTRAMINIDPGTSALTITSNSLPQIFRGVPLRVQTVNVTVNKPQFMFNPTNCEAKQITATIVSAQNATAHVSSPFAAGGCKNLPFNPGFKVATRAPGSKKKGTSLDVKVSSEPGQANIHSISVSLPKQLPSRLTTIQQACPEATFAANPATCPAGSLIGVATGTTPVLSVPVTGPAYLVSHGGAAFPDLKLILQAEGVRVDLTGSINIKGQITSSTFASIPDVPISSFDLKLPEGPHSALTPNGSLCARPLVMPTTIVGQNGRRLVRSTKVSVAGCPVKTGLRPAKKKKRGR